MSKYYLNVESAPHNLRLDKLSYFGNFNLRRFLVNYRQAISLFLVITLTVAACSSQKKSESDASSASSQAVEEPSGIPFDLNGKPVTVAGITFTPAVQWQDNGATDMRVATYFYGPLENDVLPAELAVYYFGKDQGGGIDANIKRWIGQMSLPDGGDPAKVAVVDTLKGSALPTYVLKISGTYNESVGGMMSGKTTPRENYRMVGVIVSGPEGNVFFKLTGPDHTAKVMSEALIAMVGQISSAAQL
jgi:hypothetical protein